jgi:diacylglycerol O-acyltransferase
MSEAPEPMRFEARMSDMDALMWTIEKDPLLRSTITAVTILDREPDRERLLDKVERATRLIPRLRQRPIRAPLSPAPPRWVVDAGFSLDYHVRWLRAPGAGSQGDLLSVVEPVAMQGFDRARPLWEFVVVEGLADGRAALVQKLHHSITDGVGGVRLAMMLLDLDRDPPLDTSPLPEAPLPEQVSPASLIAEDAGHELRRQAGIARRVGGRLSAAAGDPRGAVRRARATATSVARMMAPAFEPLSPVMKGRSLQVRFATITQPINDLKAAAKRVDGRLNDAFVAAVTGGLRRYHDAHDRPVDALRMTMPINIRSGGNEALAGNQFVPARFVVPIGITDPVERMTVVRDLVRRQRDEPGLAFTEPMAGVLNRLPASITTQLFGAMLKGSDFITSNVPGAPVTVYLAGAQVGAIFPFGPLSGAALSVVLLSYRDELHVGVNRDPAAVPDGDTLLACLEEGFDEVRKLA